MSKEHSASLKSAREQALATHEKAVAAMKQQLAQVHTAELEELQDELDTGVLSVSMADALQVLIAVNSQSQARRLG